MPVWVVTGGSGFLGRHVLDALSKEASSEVVAMGRRCPANWPLERFARVDLLDLAMLRTTFEAIAPDLVIHAAGRTPPAEPLALYESNTNGTLALLDALRGRSEPTRIVLAGSAAELGPVPVEDLPVADDHPCRPVEPYGLSKWLATCAGLVAGPPLEVVIGRVFNPIGPGLSTNQAFGRFAAQLADPARTSIQVGDLEARRDFIDVRDVGQALIALARSGRPGRVYNIGRGTSERIGDGLDLLIRQSARTITIEADPHFKGRPGPSDSRAKIDDLVEQTGWSPRFSFEESLRDLWAEAKARRFG